MANRAVAKPPSPWRRRVRAVPWLVDGAPWWVAAILALGLIAAGLLLIVRPLSALELLGIYVGVSCIASGIAELIAHRGEADRDLLTLVRAAVWIAVGITGVFWWGRDVDLFVPTVALLVCSGAVALVRLVRDRSWTTRSGPANSPTATPPNSTSSAPPHCRRPATLEHSPRACCHTPTP